MRNTWVNTAWTTGRQTGQVTHAIGLLEQSKVDHPNHEETQAILARARRANPKKRLLIQKPGVHIGRFPGLKSGFSRANNTL